jgi:rubredoxin
VPKNGDPEYPVAPGTKFEVGRERSSRAELPRSLDGSDRPAVLPRPAACVQFGCAQLFSPPSFFHLRPLFPQDLPGDWQCPVCGAEKKLFQSRQLEVAGFAENQGYGLGTNTMTGEQKSLLIFGSLGVFFLLFLLGYAMD